MLYNHTIVGHAEDYQPQYAMSRKNLDWYLSLTH